MFGLFSRPGRRPRTVHRPVRPRLCVQALEARANPSAPVLSNVAASWTGDGRQVVISGTVMDENPGTVAVHVTGAAQDNFHPDAHGNLLIYVNVADTGSVYVQAQDDQNLMSSTTTIQNGIDLSSNSSGQAESGYAAGKPVLRDVTITNENGVWHIRGNVDNTSPVNTIIEIIGSSIPGETGNTVTVNPDGSFDIGIVLDPKSTGGSISIIAIDQDTGEQSDQWDGMID
ncbi:MAG TPA: hypothetical protein VGF55_06900 [Gemmataceae bacterium]|jgi:hypothetical protein